MQQPSTSPSVNGLARAVKHAAQHIARDWGLQDLRVIGGTGWEGGTVGTTVSHRIIKQPVSTWCGQLHHPPNTQTPSSCTYISSELQGRPLVVDAGGALEHLDHGSVAVDLQHLPTPSGPITQPDVHDLGIHRLLFGVERKQTEAREVEVPACPTRATHTPQVVKPSARQTRPRRCTLTRLTTTRGPATPPTVRYSA